MFSRRRKLKKEKSKYRFKIALLSLFFLLIALLFIEYLYLNFSFGRTVYLNPIAKNKTSDTLKLENILKTSKISFLTVSKDSDGSFTAKLTGGGEVIFSSKKDFLNQISSLQLIQSGLTIEGKKLKNLDFRYDNPVVSF